MATTTPNYARDIGYDQSSLATANTNRDGVTGTYVKVMDQGAADAIITDIQVIATGTTTAGTIRFFVSNDSGTTKFFHGEIKVLAITPDGTGSNPWETQYTKLMGRCMKNGSTVYASTEKTEGFKVHVFYEKFA